MPATCKKCNAKYWFEDTGYDGVCPKCKGNPYRIARDYDGQAYFVETYKKGKSPSEAKAATKTTTTGTKTSN